MRNTCIEHPPNEPLIIIRAWQVELCEGDRCAAALLSFLEYWHNIRLDQSAKSGYQNRVAIQHGEQATQDTSLLQFHTEEQLEQGILGLYKRRTIKTSLDWLVGQGYLSIHGNPNPRFNFDRTRYFLLNVDAINAVSRSRKNVTIDHAKIPDQSQQKFEAIEQPVDHAKLRDRASKREAPSGKNASPSRSFASPSLKNDLYTKITSTDYFQEISLEEENAQARERSISTSSISEVSGEPSILETRRMNHTPTEQGPEPRSNTSLYNPTSEVIIEPQNRTGEMVKAPCNSLKKKKSKVDYSAEFEAWWTEYYQFCLQVGASAGKKPEAWTEWQRKRYEVETPAEFWEGNKIYQQYKCVQFSQRGQAIGVAHGSRYVRDEGWREELDRSRSGASIEILSKADQQAQKRKEDFFRFRAEKLAREKERETA